MPRRKIPEKDKRPITPTNWRDEGKKLLLVIPRNGPLVRKRGIEFLQSDKAKVSFRELMDAAGEGINWTPDTLKGLVDDITFVATMFVASTGRLSNKEGEMIAEAIKLVRREVPWLLRPEPELVESVIRGLGEDFPKQDRPGPAHSNAGYTIGYLDSAHRQRFGPRRPVHAAILPLIQLAFPQKGTKGWTIESIRTLASKNRLFKI